MSTPIKRRLKPRGRRTNAERTAATRKRLIEAAIDTLYRHGYAAATTIEVADRAKVSRGAMLHHFPTRVDLLIAVAEHVVLEQRNFRRARMAELGEGAKRFYAAADISWEVQKQPSTIALLEIKMATRSDPELRKGFAPLVEQMRQMRITAAKSLAGDLGLPDHAPMYDLLQAHLAALRGLAIELMFDPDQESIERARRLVTHFEHSFADALVAEVKSSRKKAAAGRG
jgi:AcrR family transcriptional regulator